MQVTLTAVASNAAEMAHLSALLGKLSCDPGTAVVTASESIPEGSMVAVYTDTPVAKKAKKTAEPEETFDYSDVEDESTEEAAPTVDDVKAACSKYVAAGGKTAEAKKPRLTKIKAILAKFKVASVDDLKEKNYAEVIAALSVK